MLLIHNLPGVRGISTCVSHTYYSAVDFQLFVVGLGVVYLIKKSALVGVVLATLLIVYGNYDVYWKTQHLGVSPILIHKDFSPQQMMDYFDQIHLQTTTYLSHYFSGVVIAYAVHKGAVLRNSLWMWLVAIMYLSAEWTTCLMNTFHLVNQNEHDHYRGVYALLSRNLYVTAASVGVLYSAQSTNATHTNKTTSAANSIRKTHSRSAGAGNRKSRVGAWLFSPLKMLSQLSFAIYMTNVWYLRTDVFVSRALLENMPQQFLKRLAYSVCCIIAFSFYFHIVFVAPFDNLRKLITRYRRNADDVNSKKET